LNGLLWYSGGSFFTIVEKTAEKVDMTEKQWQSLLKILKGERLEPIPVGFIPIGYENSWQGPM